MNTHTQVAGMLAMMVDNAMSSADEAGLGADLTKLEAATRGMARLGLSSQGELCGGMSEVVCVRVCVRACVYVGGWVWVGRWKAHVHATDKLHTTLNPYADPRAASLVSC